MERHIAIDTRGSDTSLATQFKGMELAARRAAVRYTLVGDQVELAPFIMRSSLASSLELHHTAEYIAPGEELTREVLRRRSSMRVALTLVADGKVHAMVSAGDTKALMPLSRMIIGMHPGLEKQRPPLMRDVPTANGLVTVLDLGANLDCDAETLRQFGVHGAGYVRATRGVVHPTVRLASIAGGPPAVTAAAALLVQEETLRFLGFLESNIFETDADVVVFDGFVGNASLKTIEGYALFLRDEIRNAVKSTPQSRIGALLAWSGLKKMAHDLNPRQYNGAPLLGLRDGKVVIKSHGKTTAEGFAQAILVAHKLASNVVTIRGRGT